MGFEVFVVVLVGVGVGVAERVGLGDVVDVVGLGVRVLPRLGADVVRVGFGVARVAFEGVGVRRGVYDGLVGRTGGADDASSLAVAIDVIGSDRLVTLLLSV